MKAPKHHSTAREKKKSFGMFLHKNCWKICCLQESSRFSETFAIASLANRMRDDGEGWEKAHILLLPLSFIHSCSSRSFFLAFKKINIKMIPYSLFGVLFLRKHFRSCCISQFQLFFLSLSLSVLVRWTYMQSKKEIENEAKQHFAMFLHGDIKTKGSYAEIKREMRIFGATSLRHGFSC